MTRHTAAPLVDLAQLGRRTQPVRAPRRNAARNTPQLTPYALNKEQAAAYLSVSPRTIESMIADGRLRSFRLGARRLIRRVDLETYADFHSGATAQRRTDDAHDPDPDPRSGGRD